MLLPARLLCPCVVLACLALGGPGGPARAQADDPPKGSSGAMQPYYETRPSPDPTALTSAQLFRELSSLRAILETRLDGMDKAIALLQRASERQRSEVELRVAQLQALHAEKFRSIDNQFVASKQAVESALQSSEKSAAEKNTLQSLAIAKAEATVADQLKVLYTSIGNVERNLNDKVLAVKERQDRMDGQASGISGSWIVLIGVFGILSVCLAIFGAIRASASHLEVRAKESR